MCALDCIQESGKRTRRAYKRTISTERHKTHDPCFHVCLIGHDFCDQLSKDFFCNTGLCAESFLNQLSQWEMVGRIDVNLTSERRWKKIVILVEIGVIFFLKSSTKFRRTCRFDVVSTSFRRRNDIRPFDFPCIVQKWSSLGKTAVKCSFKQVKSWSKIRDLISSWTCFDVSTSNRRWFDHPFLTGMYTFRMSTRRSPTSQ